MENLQNNSLKRPSLPSNKIETSQSKKNKSVPDINSIKIQKSNQEISPQNSVENILSSIKKINSDSSNIVTLNVSGKIFHVHSQTLEKHPDSTLGILAVSGYFEKNKKPLFLDRDNTLFPLILSFYRNGNIRLPKNVSKKALFDEISYFKLPIKFSEILEEEEIWTKIAKTIKKNVKNEVLRSILVSLAFEKDERIRFFYNIEEKSKGKTACLDAARVECPYCKQIVYFHTSDWFCLMRSHPGTWLRSEQQWSCCSSRNILLDGCTRQKHYNCLGFNGEF
ncbi:hypothetical protein MHBO_003206 [Bonamia ostreae]|uniref:BTB domain-containing protein n=1 Tax=Bonamia ostreae TaxID=126728 RepID=A0ABV2APS0_9EUKA